MTVDKKPGLTRRQFLKNTAVLSVAAVASAPFSGFPMIWKQNIKNVTLRQLINRLAGARGHWVPVGTPVQIADLIEQ